VACEILAQGKGEKVIAFKKKRRKNTHRKRGHRQPFTKVKITGITAE
jgi:large subunit ribosomal protein L21